jgi:glycosyltransferase involved in cell wall biosynthesis
MRRALSGKLQFVLNRLAKFIRILRRKFRFIVRRFRKVRRVIRRKFRFIVRRFRKVRRVIRRILRRNFRKVRRVIRRILRRNFRKVRRVIRRILRRNFRKVRRVIRRRSKKLKTSFYLLKNFHIFSEQQLNYRFVYELHSAATRNLIANQASFGRYDADELFQMINDDQYSDEAKLHTIAFRPILLLELARLIGTQPISRVDQINALNIYRFVLRNCGGWQNMPEVKGRVTHDFSYLQLCASAGEIGEWNSFASTLHRKNPTHQMVRIDAKHYKASTDGFEISSWLDEFNQLFQSFELEGISIAPNQLISLDSITSTAVSSIPNGALVTIIVSTFNPGIELLTSLKSLVNQSWENLEIIVVDDCSTKTDFIEEAKNLDPRIRVIRQEHNQGTYEARNLAMSLCNGEFITFQDSDDWSHPRRIEMQIKPLLEDEHLMATYAKGVRLSLDLFFTSEAQFPFRNINASSLFFRHSVYRDLGEFDAVRKAADSEYFSRIQTFYQTDFKNSDSDALKLCSTANLTIIRLGSESLSRSDFQNGWRHPSRSEYLKSYTSWHSRNLGDRSQLHLDGKILERPFPSPARFAIHASDALEARYEVMFALDTTQRDPQILHHIQKALDCNLKVGLINIVPQSAEVPIFQPLNNLLFRNLSVQLFAHDDIVDCNHLIIRTLRPFQYQNYLPWNISSKHISIISLDNLRKNSRKLKSPSPRVLRKVLLDPEYPVDLSKVRINAPFDLAAATWYLRDQQEPAIPREYPNRIYSQNDFDLMNYEQT